MPDTLDVGQCLVGGMKVAQFTVKNEGGAGRFCIMPEDQWPSTNFKVFAYYNVSEFREKGMKEKVSHSRLYTI